MPNKLALQKMMLHLLAEMVKPVFVNPNYWVLEKKTLNGRLAHCHLGNGVLKIGFVLLWAYATASAKPRAHSLESLVGGRVCGELGAKRTPPETPTAGQRGSAAGGSPFHTLQPYRLGAIRWALYVEKRWAAS